jgi:hypothetical protein
MPVEHKNLWAIYFLNTSHRHNTREYFLQASRYNKRKKLNKNHQFLDHVMPCTSDLPLTSPYSNNTHKPQALPYT